MLVFKSLVVQPKAIDLTYFLTYCEAQAQGLPGRAAFLKTLEESFLVYLGNSTRVGDFKFFPVQCHSDGPPFNIVLDRIFDEVRK